jgi:hypothetical protein
MFKWLRLLAFYGSRFVILVVTSSYRNGHVELVMSSHVQVVASCHIQVSMSGHVQVVTSCHI